MGRRKPVSGKKRRQQLKEKRAKNRSPKAGGRGERKDRGDGDQGGEYEPKAAAKSQPRIVTSFGGKADNPDAKLSTYFVRERDEDVKIRRKRGSLPLQPQPCRLSRSPPIADANLAVLDPIFSHPMRPRWSEGETKEVIERREAIMFRAWCKRVHAAASKTAAAARESSVRTAGECGKGKEAKNGGDAQNLNDENTRNDGAGEGVTPFEHNLEVWRQLWRVVEFSDVLLLVADVRNPLFHIPPSLVREVTAVLRKGMVIILNKTDLVSDAHVQKWRRYLEARYPGVVVAEFSTRPCLDEHLRGKGGVNSRKKRLKQRVRRDLLARHLDQHASTVIAAAVRSLPQPPSPRRASPESGSGGAAGGEGLEKKKERKTTIGLIGHPNVGKTSVLNTLVGRKAASTSRTAGHTKHLQHIPLPPYPHLPNAYVLDCPGLVFPRQAPRHLVEVMGLYPIAQIRETLSAVRFLAERIPLEQLYALRKPDYVDAEEPWSPQLIIEAYAERKGYVTGRGGAPDAHRGGLEIVRDAVDGVLLLAFDPPKVDAGAAAGAGGGRLARHVMTPYGPGLLLSSGSVSSIARATAPHAPGEDARSAGDGSAGAVVELDWGGVGYFRAPEVVGKVVGST